MTTLTDMLDTLVGTAFSATQKTKALTNSALRLKVIAADNDNTDMAIALYAAGNLSRGRAVVQNKHDSTVNVPTMESLLTKEIQELLVEDDVQEYTDNLIYFVANSTTKSSFDSRSS
ncbi:hypothetical protein LCGC14_1935010 [marine sediment metagenome]|uniref:Uncharacterized protein n=1 Tax=marine sediment metagenome TaxID=412755 RepID=A0A0F9FME9_9ZZZZ